MPAPGHVEVPHSAEAPASAGEAASALHDLATARALLLRVADAISRGQGSGTLADKNTGNAPGDRIAVLCDRLHGLVLLRFPGARIGHSRFGRLPNTGNHPTARGDAR